MTTLSLKKEYSGSYFAESESHLITIRANKVSGLMDGGWYVSIEEKTDIAVDMCGDQVQMTEQLFGCACDSKKQAVQVGTQWVIENI